MRTSPQDMYSQTERSSSSRLHWTASQGNPFLLVNRDDTSIPDMAESALHRDPERTVPVESEVIDAAFGQAVGGHVRCADLTVLDVRHATLKPKPQTALPLVRKQNRSRSLQS